MSPWCWLRGHDIQTFMLPEEVFGLYVYSRMECRRCGRVVSVGLTPDEQIQRLWDVLQDHHEALLKAIDDLDPNDPADLNLRLLVTDIRELAAGRPLARTAVRACGEDEDGQPCELDVGHAGRHATPLADVEAVRE